MENEGEMYHAAATVSTLLLKLGEVTRKYQSQSSKSENETSDKEQATLVSTSNTSSSSNEDWFITFEQLIASLLTDNLLVQYFDDKFNINSKLTEYKSQHA